MIFMAVVLQILKHAQMQNGLRHRDYTRYRYCWNLMIEMWCFEWILVFLNLFYLRIVKDFFFEFQEILHCKVEATVQVIEVHSWTWEVYS